MDEVTRAINEVDQAYARKRYAELRENFTGVFVVRWLDGNVGAAECETAPTMSKALDLYMARRSEHREVWLDADFTTGSENIFHAYRNGVGDALDDVTNDKYLLSFAQGKA